MTSGQTKNCTLTNRYVGVLDDHGHADRVLKFVFEVDNTGALSARQTTDFHLTIPTLPVPPRPAGIVNLFGSAFGTYYGFAADQVGFQGNFYFDATKQFNYAPILTGDCSLQPTATSLVVHHDVITGSSSLSYDLVGSSPSAQLNAGEFKTCKVAFKFIEHTLGTGSLLNVIQLVDNSGAPSQKLPRDFTLSVVSSSFSQQFQGSFSGTLFEVPTATDVTVSSAPVNGYFTTQTGFCNGALAAFSACTFKSAYVGSRSAGSSTNAVLQVISIVDNTGAPTLKQASDFQLSVRSGTAVVATFAGSSNGINVGLNTAAGAVRLEKKSGPANYAVSFSGDCTPTSVTINAGEFRVCTITNTYFPSPITTPTGANVGVQSGSVNINYSNVLIEGSSLATQLIPSEVGTLPGTFKIANNLAFDITTTASITAPITVCFKVPAGVASTATLFNALKVLHAENGQLVDRTVSRNFITRTICARTTSLSPFAVAEQIDDSLPSITGRITDHNGNGVSGLRLNLSGALEQSDTTDADGNYAFVNLDPGGDYAVAPAGPGYFLTPSNALFNGVNSDQIANFTAVNVQTVKFDSAVNQVFENGAVASVTVVRPSGTEGQVTVAYATSDGTARAGIDYTATSGTLTFADGVTSQAHHDPNYR